MQLRPTQSPSKSQWLWLRFQVPSLEEVVNLQGYESNPKENKEPANWKASIWQVDADKYSDKKTKQTQNKNHAEKFADK